MSAPPHQTLRYDGFAPGRPYYGILLSLGPPQEGPPGLHDHDFFEVTWMASGAGTHVVNGRELAFQAGDIYLVRPHDCHAMVGRRRASAINIAFPAATWQVLAVALGLQPLFATLLAADLPPTYRPTGLLAEQCAGAFRAALAGYSPAPVAGEPDNGAAAMALAFGELWQCLLQLILPGANAPQAGAGPDWLQRALAAMEREENLRGGMPRLVQLCAVSPEHLARVMRRELGQSPSEWIASTRLQCAARWLRATDDGIGEVAARCGFGNLNHFYRLFTARFGMPPRQYRLQARRAVAPKN